MPPMIVVLSIPPTVEDFCSALEETMILKRVQAHRDAEEMQLV